MLEALLYLGVGLIILTLGADLLVRGSGSMAVRAGLRPIIVGLTVVALGTSSPELVVSLTAALRGHTEVAIGNIVGSNLFNMLAILGFAALVRPMAIQTQTVYYETPMMIGLTAVMALLAWDGEISRPDGGALTVLFSIFLFYCYKFAKLPELERSPERRGHLAVDIVLILLGIAGLGGGGHLCAVNAVALAEALGVSKLVIGLTVVAFGTSLPELAASVVAALKKEADLSVGNVVGSNIFNLGLVLGITAIIHPIPVPTECVHIDIPIVLGVSVLILPLMWFGRSLVRAEGLILLLGLLAYTALRYGQATGMI